MNHYFALHAVSQGYPILVGLVLLAVVVLKKHREVVLSVLEAANLLVAISGTIHLILFVPEFFAVPQDDTERFATLNRWFGPYGWATWLAFVSTYVLPLLFWIRKFRRKVFYSMLMVIAYNVEVLTRFLARFQRDYLPSGWEISHPAESRVKYWVGYTSMVILTYHVTRRASRKNTPMQE
ncbi:MAG: hypothetical protein ICV83_15875 [Cytophagales bacterium]|nr:hypothetical protein [Cytophagales bacterium]